MIVVYDFDKTLTYKDTLFGFFLEFSKNPFKIFFYFCLMVCAKLKLISNDILKRWGVKLFLKGVSKDTIEKKAHIYAKKIKTNSLYKEIDLKDRVFIVSASFQEYLKPLFSKDVSIIASRLDYADGKVVGLLFNCYGKNKIDALQKEGIFKIDLFFTDSYSDKPLALLTKKIVIVKDDTKTMCNTLKEFENYFKKV